MLRDAKPFSFLTDTEFASLMPWVQRRTHLAGSLILGAGDNADGIYFIVSGRVLLLMDNREAHEYIVSVFGPNEFFGETCLFSGGPSSVSFRAQERCHTLYVSRSRLLAHVLHNARFASYMLEAVLARLKDAHHKLEGLALMTVYERVARTLIETAEDVKGNWLVRMGTEQMARMVGASREMVSRVLRQMIESGALRRDKRLLLVTDRTFISEAAATAEPGAGLAKNLSE